MYAVKATGQDALRQDLLAEFRRLCRLEGPYAEAVEKYVNPHPAPSAGRLRPGG
jgi:hypothetical protein